MASKILFIKCKGCGKEVRKWGWGQGKPRTYCALDCFREHTKSQKTPKVEKNFTFTPKQRWYIRLLHNPFDWQQDYE